VSDRTSLAEQAATLRRGFDQTFARAPETAHEAIDELLAIQAGGNPYAVRLAEVTGLYADRKIVALPSQVPELLGLSGFRGTIRPVYDLGAILGYPQGQKNRWMILAGTRSVVALAFPVFEGYCRVGQDTEFVREGPASARPHVREVVQVGGIVRPIVNLASVVEAISERVRRAAPLGGT
jgi:purine-binding chemotaxis protein CheW